MSGLTEELDHYPCKITLVKEVKYQGKSPGDAKRNAVQDLQRKLSMDPPDPDVLAGDVSLGSVEVASEPAD